MTGYESKKAAARDKLVDDRRAYYEKFDDLFVVYLNGVYDGKKAAQRPWVGLTDEEFHDLQIENIDDPWANFKAIEAKLKERNHG